LKTPDVNKQNHEGENH